MIIHLPLNSTKIITLTTHSTEGETIKPNELEKNPCFDILKQNQENQTEFGTHTTHYTLRGKEKGTYHIHACRLWDHAETCRKIATIIVE